MLGRKERIKCTKLFTVKASGENGCVEVIVLLRVNKYNLTQNNVTTLQDSIF